VTTSSIVSSSTPSTFTSLTSSNVTSSIAPRIPGFPWESIIVGISIGLVVLGIIRRRRLHRS
jgi:hypothetical protein